MAATSAGKSKARKGGDPDERREESLLRKAVLETARAMSERGLSPGRSGNVSARWRDGMLITPSGIAYDEIKPRDIVFVDGEGEVPGRQKRPSSEWRFHLGVYRERQDLAAVVHTHSMHATVLACAHKPIPAFHYMVAIAGGDDIRLVPYAPFGTSELADFVADGLKKRDACLMANHGQIAAGKSLGAALELAAEVETMAEQYVKVLTLGKPNLLSRAEMADVLERFKGYGQNAQGAAAGKG